MKWPWLHFVLFKVETYRALLACYINLGFIYITCIRSVTENFQMIFLFEFHGTTL